MLDIYFTYNIPSEAKLQWQIRKIPKDWQKASSTGEDAFIFVQFSRIMVLRQRLERSYHSPKGTEEAGAIMQAM